MTTDRDAFLRAIADIPDDDAPRLVFADWLDEHGDAARAELIRVQCTAEALPAGLAERHHLERRADHLLLRHQHDWQTLPSAAWGAIYRRGFIDSVAVDVEKEVTPEAIAQLASLVPPARLDFFELLPELASDLARMPELSRVRRLAVSSSFEDYEPPFLPLLQSPHLQLLSELAFAPRDLFDDEMASALESWPGLPEVRDLRLPYGLTLDRLRTILERTDPNRLRSLGVPDWDQFGRRLAETLLAWPGLANLRQLSFMGNDAALRWLAEHVPSTRLQVLTLTNEGPSPELVDVCLGNSNLSSLGELRIRGERFAVSDTFISAGTAEGLRRLFVRSDALDDAAVARLARSPRLASVSVLHLESRRLTRFTAELLADSPHLHGVRSLNLRGSRIGPAGVRALVGSAGLAKLTALDLSNTSPGVEGFKALAGAAWVRSLVELNLSGCRLAADSVRALASAPLHRLRVFRACGCRGKGRFWAGLSGAAWLAGLELLDLTGSGLDDVGLIGLSAHLGPDLRSLHIGANSFGVNGLRAVLARPMPALITLGLFRTSLDVEMAREIARWPGLANLCQLHLVGAMIGDASAAALLASPYWNPRTEIELDTHGTSPALRALSERVRVEWYE